MDGTDIEPAGFSVASEAHSLHFARDLDGSPEEAFAAWTDPAEVALWWDPTGERLAECDIDLRSGGSFRFVSGHHPNQPFTGTYREVSPPNRLVFDANGAVGTVTFTPNANGTSMTVEIKCSSAEHLQQFMTIGVAAGTSRTLDNLVGHFARR